MSTVTECHLSSLELKVSIPVMFPSPNTTHTQRAVERRKTREQQLQVITNKHQGTSVDVLLMQLLGNRALELKFQSGIIPFIFLR